MHGDGGYSQLDRVTEDALPVNISCVRLTVREDNRMLFYVSGVPCARLRGLHAVGAGVWGRGSRLSVCLCIR